MIKAGLLNVTAAIIIMIIAAALTGCSDCKSSDKPSGNEPEETLAPDEDKTPPEILGASVTDSAKNSIAAEFSEKIRIKSDNPGACCV